MLQALQEEERRYNGKITEMYDLIHDLEYVEGDWINVNIDQVNYKTLPEKNYQKGLVNYISATNEWWVYVPQRPYTFSYVGFKAFKPIPKDGTNPNKIFYTCDICSSSTKRVAFDYSNLTDGVDYSPLNQVPIIKFKVYDPKKKSFYGITNLAAFYSNIVLELEFIIRE